MLNIKNVDLNLLVVLNILLEERNVTRAADLLNLSQPAVSGALNRLRRTFNDPLFVRAGQGIRPTPYALSLVGPIKSVLQDIDGIFTNSNFEPGTTDSIIRIAATDYALITFLAPLIRNVHLEAPSLKFSIVSTDIRKMPEQFDRQEIDFAITVPEMAPNKVHSLSLFEDRYVCAVGRKHPLPVRDITLDKFCNLDHVLVTPSSDGFEGPTDSVLLKLGRRRRVSVSVPNFLSLPSLLENTEFITVAPERVLRPFSDLLKIFTPPFRIPDFPVVALWHDFSHRSVAHVWLRKKMNETAKSMHT